MRPQPPVSFPGAVRRQAEDPGPDQVTSPAHLFAVDTLATARNLTAHSFRCQPKVLSYPPAPQSFTTDIQEGDSIRTGWYFEENYDKFVNKNRQRLVSGEGEG
ncbi:hypothetical protein J6590_008149 [Homalodisca vitripennis]|nr:hypothetical protein J6590_008149 [Homalodisca vitripennis]